MKNTCKYLIPTENKFIPVEFIKPLYTKFTFQLFSRSVLSIMADCSTLSKPNVHFRIRQLQECLILESSIIRKGCSKFNVILQHWFSPFSFKKACCGSTSELFEPGCTRLILVCMKMDSSFMLLVSVTFKTDQNRLIQIIHYACLCTSAVL